MTFSFARAGDDDSVWRVPPPGALPCTPHPSTNPGMTTFPRWAFCALTFLATTAAAPSAIAAGDPFDDPLIQKVRERHDKGVDGDKQAVIDLVKDLEQWTLEQPDNQLLKVYLGSCYTLRSRDVIFYKKMDYLDKAKVTMTEAVDADPDDVAVRFVRAVNLISLPAIFGTREMARDDFKHMLGILEGPNPPTLKLETRQAIYKFAGRSYLDTDERSKAIEVWNKGAALAPDSELGKEMAANVKRYDK